MQVVRFAGNRISRPHTDPLLEADGFWWELRAGQILDPISDPDGWFNPLPPESVLRFWLPVWAAVAINIAWLVMTAAALLALCVNAPAPVAAAGSIVVMLIHILAPVPGRWLSWKIGRKGGYSGTKIYGVDDPNYAAWAGAENVYPGSLAMHFSVRPFATIKEG